MKRNNESLSLIAEPFNRQYMLMGTDSTKFLWGKTIHDSLQTHTLFTHYPKLAFPNNRLIVPMEYGHVSHFRKNYNIYCKDCCINDANVSS